MRITTFETARFWSKVNVVALDRRWNWQAGLFSNGYGQFKWRGQSIQAHRIESKA